MDQALPHIVVGFYLLVGVFFYLNIVRHIPKAINPIEGTNVNTIDISLFNKIRFFIGVFLSHLDEVIIWPISRFYLNLYPEKDSISSISHDHNRDKNYFHFSSWKDERYFIIKLVYIVYILAFQVGLSLIYTGVLLKIIFIISIIGVSSYFINFITGAGVVIEKISGGIIKYLISLISLSTIGILTMSISFLGLENPSLIQDISGIYDGVNELMSLKQIWLLLYSDETIIQKVNKLIYSDKSIRLLGAAFIYYTVGRFLYSSKGYEANSKRTFNNLLNAFKIHDYKKIENYLATKDTNKVDKVDRIFINSCYDFYKKNYKKSIEGFTAWFQVQGKYFIELDNNDNAIFHSIIREVRNLNFNNDVYQDFLILWMNNDKCSDLIISQSCRLLFEVDAISPRFLYNIFAQPDQNKSYLFTELLVLYHFHENLEGDTPDGYKTWNFAKTMYSMRSISELNKSYRVVFDFFLALYSLVFSGETLGDKIQLNINESLDVMLLNPNNIEYLYSVLYLSHTINMLDKHGKEKVANEIRDAASQYTFKNIYPLETIKNRLKLLQESIKFRVTEL